MQKKIQEDFEKKLDKEIEKLKSKNSQWDKQKERAGILSPYLTK